MSEKRSIARPYAKAAFYASKSAHQLPLWSLALNQLSLIIQDSKMKSLLKNPHYTRSQFVELLNSLLCVALNNKSEKNNTSIENFIKVLSEKKRLNLLPDISELFEEHYAKESGYLSLIVTSAFIMDELQKNNTTEKLSKKFNSTCDIHFHVDKNLIGGLLVRSGHWVLDGTIKGTLSRLKSVLG